MLVRLDGGFPRASAFLAPRPGRLGPACSASTTDNLSISRSFQLWLIHVETLAVSPFAISSSASRPAKSWNPGGN
jgi:hypothetical protein